MTNVSRCHAPSLDTAMVRAAADFTRLIPPENETQMAIRNLTLFRNVWRANLERSYTKSSHQQLFLNGAMMMFNPMSRGGSHPTVVVAARGTVHGFSSSGMTRRMAVSGFQGTLDGTDTSRESRSGSFNQVFNHCVVLNVSLACS